MDPATAILIMGGLGLLGGMFDDTSEQQLGLSKEQLAESKRQFGITSGLGAGSFLSRLLDQRQRMQDRQGSGAGSMAALMGGGQ